MEKRTMRTFLTIIMAGLLVTTLALILLADPPLWLNVALILSAILLATLIRWHAVRTRYSCSSCGHAFKIGAFKDFFSAHVPSKKLLTCPACKNVDWCEELDL